MANEEIPPRYTVENGELVLASARAILDGIDWTDYAVKVRVCVKESVASGQGAFSISVRRTPNVFGGWDRYGVVLTCVDGKPVWLWLGLNFNDAPKSSKHVPLQRTYRYDFVRDKWYTLELEVRGQQLKVHLDGKLVMEASDSRLSKGGVMIDAWRCNVLVDEFSVRKLP
jgi:hypothetical protein